MYCGRSLSIAAWALVAACGTVPTKLAAKTVAGQDDHGDAIELSVECERFDEVVAERG